MDHNRVHIIGRLTKDPEYHPPGRRGDAHCTFTLAVNRVVANEQGPQADYIPCVLWGEEVTRFIESRAKGDEVGVLGRIRTGNVQQADGSTKFFWEIRVDQIHYGRRALKNLQPKPTETAATRAVATLGAEFGDHRE